MSTMATFVVRNDKFRGLLIESMEDPNGDVYFFKNHNQPIDRHCSQMQNIIKAANVKRTRRVSINIMDFVNEYFNPTENYVWFRGIKMESTNTQIANVLNMRVNKEAGALKRAATINEKKQQKAEIEKQKFKNKQALIEKVFQEERAKRIHEVTQEINMRNRMNE